MLDIIVESPLYQEIQLDAKKEHSREFLLKLVKGRFGKVEKSVAATIKTLTIEQTENLGVKLFKIETIEEFKMWLAKFEKKSGK